MTCGKLRTSEGNGGEVIVIFGSVRPDFRGGNVAITIAWDEVKDDGWDLMYWWVVGELRFGGWEEEEGEWTQYDNQKLHYLIWWALFPHL